MEIIAFIIKFLGGAALMGGVVYLFKLFKEKKPADIIPFNNIEREAAKKAQRELELGIEDARSRYQAAKERYMQRRKDTHLKALNDLTNDDQGDK